MHRPAGHFVLKLRTEALEAMRSQRWLSAMLLAASGVGVVVVGLGTRATAAQLWAPARRARKDVRLNRRQDSRFALRL
jgi:hypothetical protein